MKRRLGELVGSVALLRTTAMASRSALYKYATGVG